MANDSDKPEIRYLLSLRKNGTGQIQVDRQHPDSLVSEDIVFNLYLRTFSQPS